MLQYYTCMQYRPTVIQKIHTYTKMNLISTVKWAQWDKTQSRGLLGPFICVCIALRTIVAHNIAQNNLIIFPLRLLPSRQSPLLRWCLFEGREEAEILDTDRLYQVLALGLQITPKRGVIRVTWPILNFLAPVINWMKLAFHIWCAHWS